MHADEFFMIVDALLLLRRQLTDADAVEKEASLEEICRFLLNFQELFEDQLSRYDL